MIRACGRIRKGIGDGWTQITNGELAYLDLGVLRLSSGATHEIPTKDREYAVVLVHGECHVRVENGPSGVLGPRRNPFDDLPSAFLVTRDEILTITATADSLLGVASSPARKRFGNTVVSAKDVQVQIRGAENWSRQVRKVIWSDNTEGNLLLAGETCTPSGNWSTIPPHRHQQDVEGEEAPYEEIYFFQFSHPHGYVLIWQFDDEGDMDQAFSLKSGDVVYQNQGYHPVVCSPGTELYHLTFMAGPRRESMAKVHENYQYILDEFNLKNQFTPR